MTSWLRHQVAGSQGWMLVFSAATPALLRRASVSMPSVWRRAKRSSTEVGQGDVAGFNVEVGGWMLGREVLLVVLQFLDVAADQDDVRC